MYVTIRVQADVALALHQRQQHTAASEEILETIKELGAGLEPVHPGTEDPHLLPYFSVKVQNSEMAERAIARLRQYKAIEAAYLKPPDAMP